MNISAIGDAKTLQGGVLMQNAVARRGCKVYAVAQGAIAVGGFIGGNGGAAMQRIIPPWRRFPAGRSWNANSDRDRPG